MSVGSALRAAALPAALVALSLGPLQAREPDVQSSPSPSPRPAAPPTRTPTPRPSATPQPTVTIRPTSSPRPSASPHVYSNKDLPEQPSPSPEAEGKKDQKDQKAQKAPPAPTPEPTPDAAAQALEAERQRMAAEEAGWRNRAGAARETVRTADAEVTRLQDEAARIANRILMSTDTNEILRLRAEQQKVQASLEAARAGLDAARKALDDLQEEARRAGVPVGWVRED